jgi:hypothetical protein
VGRSRYSKDAYEQQANKVKARKQRFFEKKRAKNF